jgi:hypothetical protein
MGLDRLVGVDRLVAEGVVGEHERAFYGNQLLALVPVLEAPRNAPSMACRPTGPAIRG